jgi:hypothetical protein
VRWPDSETGFGAHRQNLRVSIVALDRSALWRRMAWLAAYHPVSEALRWFR